MPAGLPGHMPSTLGIPYAHPHKGTADIRIRVQAVDEIGLLVYDKRVFGGPTPHYPDVAAGPKGSFLVAWQDKDVSAPDAAIRGQLGATASACRSCSLAPWGEAIAVCGNRVTAVQCGP